MKRPPWVIRDNRSLLKQYHLLEPGDVICCRLQLKPGEEHLLLDLAERGIKAIPSLRAQLCSRSKAFQTRLFSWAMLPETTVIYTIHDLLQAIGSYGRAGREQVVVKQEGKNGGLGIFLFKTIEDVYTQSATHVLPYPYVLQPFFSVRHDLRVIILGDYFEAYERYNPDNFRQNLHFGGQSRPWSLSAEQLNTCRKVMEQGDFPYAHIDLMVTGDDRTYFTEINLRGGLRGARISSAEYHRRIEEVHVKLCTMV